MSATYPDLSLTNFPDNIDTFTTWLNIVATDGPLIQQYQAALQAGNQTLANQILAQIPQGTQKIITATDLNTLTQAMLAVERFYQTDIEPYVAQKQADWLTIIQQFSYQGVWSSGTSYVTNNFVTYTVSGLTLLYLAIADPPVGTLPTNTQYWRLLTIQGQPGTSGTGLSYRQEWQTGVSYSTNDAVTYDGALWLALQNSQGREPSTNPSYWKLVMSLETTTYPIQDIEPTNLDVGGLWFNTQDNPTKYYYLEPLTNEATADQIIYGQEAYDDMGNLIIGTLPVPASIAVTTNPNKTSYIVGESFDPTGMVVTVTYTNGNQVAVAGYTYSPTGALTIQDTSITIQYTESGATVDTSLNITVTNPIYGVSWDGSSTTLWTRTDSAAGFSNPTPAVNNGTGSSPFDNIMPWSGMQKVQDATGGVLVSIPKYWYKWTRSGSSMQLQISPIAKEGFYVSPAHADRGDGQGERDMVYVGRYHCASGYKSTTGAQPLASITRNGARSSIRALGSEYWQYDFAMYWTIMMLYLVEYANWNSQATIGYGCSPSSQKFNMGATDAMIYHTGTSAASRTTYGSVQYRHIEGLWDNVYDWCDGIRFSGSTVYCIANPASFSDTSGGTNVGTRATSSGWISGWTNPTADGFEYALYPNAVSGSETTYVCDFCNYSASGVVLRVGGDYSQVQSHGAFYLSGDSTASSANANIGCRLQKLPNNT